MQPNFNKIAALLSFAANATAVIFCASWLYKGDPVLEKFFIYGSGLASGFISWGVYKIVFSHFDFKKRFEIIESTHKKDMKIRDKIDQDFRAMLNSELKKKS